MTSALEPMCQTGASSDELQYDASAGGLIPSVAICSKCMPFGWRTLPQVGCGSVGRACATTGRNRQDRSGCRALVTLQLSGPWEQPMCALDEQRVSSGTSDWPVERRPQSLRTTKTVGHTARCGCWIGQLPRDEPCSRCQQAGESPRWSRDGCLGERSPRLHRLQDTAKRLSGWKELGASFIRIHPVDQARAAGAPQSPRRLCLVGNLPSAFSSFSSFSSGPRVHLIISDIIIARISFTRARQHPAPSNQQSRPSRAQLRVRNADAHHSGLPCSPGPTHE